MPKVTSVIFESCMALVLTTGPLAHGESSVCEILTDLEKVHGTVVRVKGILVSGQSEWLVGEKCKAPLVIGKWVFDNLVSVEWPDSRYVIRESAGMISFPVDEPGRELLREAIKRHPIGLKIPVIIEGLIVTRIPMTALVHPKRPDTPRGFGHLGAAPAMIVVKKLVSIGATLAAAKTGSAVP